MRIVIALAVAGAVTFMSGLLLVVVGVAMQTLGKHPDEQLIGTGAEIAVAGFSSGMIVLAVLVVLRAGTTTPASRGQQRGAVQTAAATAGPGRPAEAGGPAWPGGPNATAGQDRSGPPPGARRVAGTGPQQRTGGPAQPPGNGSGGGQRAQGAGTRPPAGGQAGQGQGAKGQGGNGQDGRPHRSQREQVLNPTGVYTPGGLLDMPGSTPPGSFAQDQPSPARAAGGPSGGYRTSAGQAHGTGQGQGPAGGQRPNPSRTPGPGPGQGRGPGQAGGPGQGRRPGQGPGTGSFPGTGPFAGAGPAQGRAPGQGYGTGPVSGQAAPGPAAGAPAWAQPGPGWRQQQQASWPPGPEHGHEHGHEHGYPQGHQPAPPSQPGPREPLRQDFGGTSAGTAMADPAMAGTAMADGAQAGVYVYRDTGGPDEPETPVANEREAAYWYGQAEPEQPEPLREARGPFEPLISSDAPPVIPEPSEEPAEEPEDPAAQQAQKLEQIKDFYLTAEAIGEDNVDKHFDQLLAQQRELIDEYFKQSKVRPTQIPGQDEPAQDGTAQAGASAGSDW